MQCGHQGEDLHEPHSTVNLSLCSFMDGNIQIILEPLHEARCAYTVYESASSGFQEIKEASAKRKERIASCGSSIEKLRLYLCS